MVKSGSGEATCKVQDQTNVVKGCAGAELPQVRILWPALGFPEVVAPGDPIKLLLLASVSAPTGEAKVKLTPKDVKKYLRYVTWAERMTRYSNKGTFSNAKISIKEPKIRGDDELVIALDFANLSKDVRNFYKENGFGVEFYYDPPVEEPVETSMSRSDSPGILNRLFGLGRK